jgi:hypothetical protein
VPVLLQLAKDAADASPEFQERIDELFEKRVTPEIRPCSRTMTRRGTAFGVI